jgi:DNA-binding Lrp family transcriptional regulator
VADHVHLVQGRDADTRVVARGKRTAALRTMPALSPTDVAIIEALQEDARKPFSQIARDLGFPTRQLRRRIAELEEANIIRFTAVADPTLLGYHAFALVGIKVSNFDRRHEVVKSLLQVDALDYVAVVTGRFDVIAELASHTFRGLGNGLGAIGAIDGISELETFTYLSVFYQQFGFHPAQGVQTKEIAIDDLDRFIIRELYDYGRTPFEVIGGHLGVTEATVRRRVGRLCDQGALRIIALTSPLSLDFQAMAWVAISVRADTAVRQVAEQLVALEGVAYVAVCTGRFDIFVDIIARDAAELWRRLDDEIRAIPGIAAIEAWRHLEAHHWRPLHTTLATSSEEGTMT